MRVEVLVCRPDGTQALETREFPSNWFEIPAEEERNGEDSEE